MSPDIKYVIIGQLVEQTYLMQAQLTKAQSDLKVAQEAAKSAEAKSETTAQQ
jgi:hypothetical protein